MNEAVLDLDHDANNHAPQRRPVNTFKVALLCMMLSLIVILSSTVGTLYLILESRQDVIASKSSTSSSSSTSSIKGGDVMDQSYSNEQEDQNNYVTKVLTPIRPEDVQRTINSYKNLAPDPRSSVMISDAEFGLGLQKILCRGIRRMNNNAGDGMMIVLSHFKKNVDELQKSAVPYSSTSDYRWMGKQSYSGKKSWRKHRRVTDVKSWIQYHLEHAALDTLVDILKSMPVFKEGSNIEIGKHDQIEKEYANIDLSKNSLDSLYNIKKASDLGNPHAQSLMASYYASGIIPWVDNSLLEDEPEFNVTVASEFSDGGDNLAKALFLWHFASIGGVLEAQMAMGFRYSPKVNGNYGLEASCEKSLAYYEEAANAAIDELEASPLRAKVMPAHDGHRLSEIYMHGGASSALSNNNKPNELDEALDYYRILASTHEDEHAALTLGTMHALGIRGVPQDLSLALKYYKIAAEKSNREACGQVGKIYLLGQGVQQDIFKAFQYCSRGAPGDLHCSKDCDPTSLNCLGQLYLRGVPFRVERNVDRALMLFKRASDLGSVDASYNLAMMHLGWMSGDSIPSLLEKTFFNDVDQIAQAAIKAMELTGENTFDISFKNDSNARYAYAYKLFVAAAKNGHLQALHRAGLMASRGIGLSGGERNCKVALTYFAQVAEASPSITRHTRAAYKEYVEGNLDQALQHYLVAGEVGIELAQSNAAFLLEQGTCLGMNSISCASASLRMWKAAALQGNSEASLKVGDFHYYGKHRRETTASNSIRGVLKSKKKKVIELVRRHILGEKQNNITSNEANDKVCNSNDSTETCPLLASKEPSTSENMNRSRDFEIAANFYRKAADTSSPQANFNLGYMHQWGIGLKQDFPLAKRFYDFAGNHIEAELPVQFALAVLKVHQWWIKFHSFENRKKLSIIRDHFFRRDSLIIVFLIFSLLTLSRLRKRRERYR